MTTTPGTTTTAGATDTPTTVYQCPDCEETTTERRCPDCHLFTRRLGPGGHCPHCDELILTTEITN